MDATLLAAHVEWVGKTHSVKVVYDQKDWRESFACKGTPVVTFLGMGYIGWDLQVHIAEVVDEKTYVVAMHELGHTIAENGMLSREDPKNIIVAERAAWSWAESNVLLWTAEMAAVREQVMGTPYRSQYDAAGEFHPTYERHHVNVLFEEAATVADRVRPRSTATVKSIVERHAALANNGRCPHCAQKDGCHHPACKVGRR